MNRLGLKISCFIASVLIWIQVAATTNVEQAARLPLRVSGLAEGLTVAGNDIPQNVMVRLSGSKLRLMANRFLNQPVGEVRLNLADRGPADEARIYRLSEGDVVSELDVVRFQSDTRVRLRIDEDVARRLPVAVMLAGELPRGAGFLVEPHAVPDSAEVRGPSRFVPRTGALATEPVNLDRMEAGQSGSLEVELRSPHEFVATEPGEYTVTYFAHSVDPLGTALVAIPRGSTILVTARTRATIPWQLYP